MNTMRFPESPTYEYHQKTYPGKSYLDFIPTFNEEVKKWDPEEWAALFKKIGAKYVVSFFFQ